MFEDNKVASGSPRTLVCALGDRLGSRGRGTGSALQLARGWACGARETRFLGGRASWASPEELSTWLLLPPFGAFEKDLTRGGALVGTQCGDDP